MAKIQLTLSTGYVPTWGAWEGVREVVQNALDAHDDGHELSVKHSGDTLRVASDGVKLDANVWLLGTSSKDSSKHRGHFGEGLKLGVLALVRAGHSVKIVNDDESWTPRIEESEAFDGADVLAIYTRSRKPTGKFVVEIGGISREAWAELKPRFTFLVQPEDVVSTYYGNVLLDPDLKGKVYVKGIFVETKSGLSAGYDLMHASTDRDRRMVDAWDIKYHMARAWEEAMTHEDARTDAKVMEMLKAGAEDVAEFGSSYNGLSELVAGKIAASFVAEYGDDALPVTSMADSREAAHMGKRGVVVPESFARAIKNVVGSLESVREAFKTAVSHVYSWDDLSDAEQNIYTDALVMVETAADALGFASVEPRLSIVDFSDPSLNGLHEGTGGIKLARKLLADFDETLRVLVHEVAHDRGADGEKSHEVAEGRIFARIVSSFRGS